MESMLTRIIVVLLRTAYVAVPFVALYMVYHGARSTHLVLWDVVLSTVPMVLLAAIGWRLVWPRWKLIGKLLVHPSMYAILSLYLGHWCVLVAWIHQGIGLVGHIWFSRKHGFTWYAVEDAERYIRLSKEMVGVPNAEPPAAT